MNPKTTVEELDTGTALYKMFLKHRLFCTYPGGCSQTRVILPPKQRKMSVASGGNGKRLVPKEQGSPIVERFVEGTEFYFPSGGRDKYCNYHREQEDKSNAAMTTFRTQLESYRRGRRRDHEAMDWDSSR